ncbi:hexokinase type 2-like isoform X2 [Drosophila innubila]|uniref:hexokinase type 2-like isoform X2 n=1 Tax=Drosophila innubila TaxID=198719 RepID=UPI00148D59D8|nr:hexokinase type 2-like isoform X2 [Drosophila innubila]
MIRQSTYLCRSYVEKLFRPAKRLTSRFPEAFNICKDFRIPKEKMVEIVSRLIKDIELGLAKATNPEAKVKCFISYVQDLPTGEERGKYLGLDLGGTNFRCLLINLKEGLEFESKVKRYVISHTMMQGPGRNLFHFIAECLAEFCKEHEIDKTQIPLGFTFSFPVQQVGINKGILTTWTKGFQCDDVVGKDVVELLQKAIDRRGDIRVKVVAILNDTTGTLVSCARAHKDCRIGLIVGTGVNACYMEKTTNAEMFEDYKTSKKPFMVINTELGAFGDDGALDFIRTSYDKAIDLNTVNPEKQTFEKCTSGMFLGPIIGLY